MKNTSTEITKKSNRLAVIYQSCYLLNLLLLPGLAFMALTWLFFKNKGLWGVHKVHLYRACQLSLCAGIFIIIIPLAVIYLATDFQSSLMVMLVYVITMHALFVLLGMFNIARAMANKLPLF